MTSRRERATDIDWEHVYVANAGRLRRLIARRVDPAVVDDVLQETFLRAFRGSHRLDRDRPIEPWLTTIAVRAAVDACDGGGAMAVDPLEEAVATTGARSVEDEYEARERSRLVHASLASLTARHRRLLSAVDLEGRTQSSVARSEGLHPDAVRAATARARHRFRVSYERFAVAAPDPFELGGDQARRAARRDSQRPYFLR